jgi:tetratricopeptide (TPR) repeat protein
VRFYKLGVHLLKRQILPTLVSIIILIPTLALAQAGTEKGTFKLALPSHPGQLQWHAEDFKLVETSAKPNGEEIGFRGRDRAGRLTFLGFLFLVPNKASTSATCRDEAMKIENQGNNKLRTLSSIELTHSGELPVEVVKYAYTARDGVSWYAERGFVATGNICGDLEIYGKAPLGDDDPELKGIFDSYRLNMDYEPQFPDIFLYAEILYHHRMFKASGPIFEQALAKLPNNENQQTLRRALTDEEGMSYGMSGDIPKARAIFEAAIAKDPTYPLYYYNLACADAEEKKLDEARTHLRQAFDRKANVLPGETMPNPSEDDSFTPFQSNKDFWSFIQGLH